MDGWKSRKLFGNPTHRVPAACACIFLLFLTAPITSAASQDEIAAVRLTDISGAFSVRYRFDEWYNRNDQYGTYSFTSLPLWEEELSLKAQGYVYHPAFLDWTIGGGPLFVQYAYESDVGDSDGSEILFNFNSEFNFLERRSYPFTLYYRRDHPEITAGLSGRFLAETNDYGIRGTLQPPVSPVTMNWEATHWDSNGSGFGTTVDEVVDRISVRTTLPYLEGNNLNLDLDWNERDSRSGAPGLPIQQSNITTTSAKLRGNNRFGADNSVRLNQQIIWLRQETQLDTTSELENLNYNGTLNWQHRKDLRSFATLRFNDSERTENWSRTGSFRTGVIYDFAPDITVTADGGYNRDKAPGFARDTTGARTTALYRRVLSFGNFGASANLGIERIDQQSDTDLVSVIDEPVVLEGTAPVALSREFVDSGSVIVTNVPKTQTFLEDIDYRLVTIGSVTTIERLISGSIFDGQTVLVSYDVLTGGTVEYDRLTQGISLNLGLFRYASLFFQYNDTGNDIISGISTTPLNDVMRFELGGRVDYPFNSGWTAGGEYRYTNQDEDISPYTRNSYDFYTQTRNYWNTNVRFTVHHETVDNENSPEDVDMFRYLLGITSRLPGGWVFAYNAEYSKDDGGTLPRESERHSMRLNWRYRQVLFTLRADRYDNTQGNSRSGNRRITAELRRVF